MIEPCAGRKVEAEMTNQEAAKMISNDMKLHHDYLSGQYQKALNMAIDALLKEQEPILLENQHKPYGISTNANSPWISRCPRCGKKVEGKQTRFCKYCGQAVKWDV